jgi:signal transduction histidine kinase
MLVSGWGTMLHPPFVLDPAPPSVTPERLRIAHAKAMVRRLSRFALCWLATASLWKAVVVLQGVVSLPLGLASLALEAAILATAHRLCHRDPARAKPILIAACVALGLSSTALFAFAHGQADVLAFMLLTLYLVCALFFAWGWRAELAVLASTSSAWAASAPYLVFDIPALELGAAIAIGSALSLAIAEASARSFRLAYLHWTNERRGRNALEISRDEAERARAEAERARDEAETARLEAERARAEAEAATRAKDQFLAIVSHELRAPIGVVLAWTELARREALDADRLRHALGVIETNTRAQVRLIEDLLDVARIVSGRLKIERTEVDVNAVIAAVAEALRPAAEAKGIALQVRPALAAAAVAGDEARLRQVVENVVSNAIKFTAREGSVSVASDTGDADVVVTVRDTGRGIEPVHLQSIFDRFEQPDAAITRHGGLGLGLSIARHIVELHGGTIAAESPGLGRGATFRIALPRAAGGLARWGREESAPPGVVHGVERPRGL